LLCGTYIPKSKKIILLKFQGDGKNFLKAGKSFIFANNFIPLIQFSSYLITTLNNMTVFTISSDISLEQQDHDFQI